MNHQEKLEEERQIWNKRIAELAASGMTVSEYGKIHSLSVHQIYYWKTKFAGAPKNAAATAEVKIKPSGPVVRVLAKPETKSSRLPDPKWIAELIKGLHEVF